MARNEDKRRLPKEIWQLGWISFFNDVCSEMAYPILALFMTALGQSPAVLGLVEGIAESIVSFMKGVSGAHSDLKGKRVPYVQGGYFLSTVSKLSIALARGWPLILVGRSLDRFGKGVRNTARDTLLVESVDKTRLGAAFGLQRGLDTAGAFLGVLLTLALLFVLKGDRVGVYRTIFLVSIAPGLIAVLLTFRLHEAQREPVKQCGAKFRALDLPAGYWKAVCITTVFALANSSDTFLILRANEVFKGAGVAAAAMLAILGYALYNAVYAVVSYPAGHLSDKIGRWSVLGTGWFLYAVAYLGFGTTGPGLIWLLFGVYGVYIGMTDGVSKALVGDHLPKEAKGTAMGLYAMINGFATLAASALMGLVWTKAGERPAFYMASGFAMVSVVLVLVFGRARKMAAAQA